ncbi:MAG TPA: hypothetical protein VGT41_02960 [Candidatus Babeliales bacterium]|nr:hypothetical protein [Candidatus Babeliales bacterium]
MRNGQKIARDYPTSNSILLGIFAITLLHSTAAYASDDKKSPEPTPKSRTFSWKSTWPFGDGWYSDIPDTDTKVPETSKKPVTPPAASNAQTGSTSNNVAPKVVPAPAQPQQPGTVKASRAANLVSSAVNITSDWLVKPIFVTTPRAVCAGGKWALKKVGVVSEDEPVSKGTGRATGQGATFAAKWGGKLTTAAINEATEFVRAVSQELEKKGLLPTTGNPMAGKVSVRQWFSALLRRATNAVQDLNDAEAYIIFESHRETILQPIDPDNQTSDIGAKLFALDHYGLLPFIGSDNTKNRAAFSNLLFRASMAKRDREVLYNGVAQVYATIAGSWLLNNSLATGTFTMPTITAASITVLARDRYHYNFVIKPGYVALTPIASPSPKVVGCDRFSISKTAVAKLEQLQKRNKERGNDGNPPIKNLTHDVITPFLEDIRAGRVVIRDRNSVDEDGNPAAIPAIIDVYKEGSAKALDTENIKFTLEREIAEINAAIQYLETYNYNIDCGEDWYQAGWKFDYLAAKKAAKITPATMFYDITSEQFKAVDDFMKEKDPIWEVALRIPRIDVACAWYPTRLPYLAQPSRWICSYAMPFFAYQRAKLAWWGFVQQKEAAEAIYKLLVPPVA